MAKRAEKQGATMTKSREKKKATKPASVAPEAATVRTVTEAHDMLHRSTFALMVARSNHLGMPMVCYRVFDDGSAQVCRLKDDGSYGDCETYTHRPVPGPRCG
jgi:hypothetical protein